MTWYVLQHKPSQGDRAVEHLGNQGITCFYPKISVERVRSGRRSKKLEPLFPGYLFVDMAQTDPLWAKLRSTRGVLRVVGFAHGPAPIPDDAIAYIKASLCVLADCGGIEPGQAVELDDGPFKGVGGIFQTYDGDERALVLINFMQRQQVVKVPLGAIKKSP